MFEGLDDIDWESMGVPDASQWIRELVSDNQQVRDDAFDNLLDQYIYERPRYASHVIPFMIRIVADENTPIDITPLLLTYLMNTQYNVQCKIKRGAVHEKWLACKEMIDGAINIYKSLVQHPDFEIRDSAIKILHVIEHNKWYQ